MKYLSIVVALTLTVASVPLSAIASGGHDHGSHGDSHNKKVEKSEHDHGSHGDHDGMSADGSMIIVGSQTSKGVKGMAHLKDVSETMSEMGMNATHHFMMAFIDKETGDQLEKGTVALKITNPDAKVGETIELMGMDGHFGVDIVLDMPGEYHFKVGTKLEDGKKRKYHFHYKNK